MPAEPPVDIALSPPAGQISITGHPPTVISLDKEAERVRLSVTDQIALQDADLRKWMADRVVPAFLKANGLTLAAVAVLVVLDEINIASHLITGRPHHHREGHHGRARGHHGAGRRGRGPHRAISVSKPSGMTRIVTSTYRPKRAPRKPRPQGAATTGPGDQGVLRAHDATTRSLMPARSIPRRHWRYYGDHPLPTGGQALNEPLRAFPSWFLRIEYRLRGVLGR